MRPVDTERSQKISREDRIRLTVFPQTSILLIRKLCCMCLKTTKQFQLDELGEERSVAKSKSTAMNLSSHVPTSSSSSKSPFASTMPGILIATWET